MNSVWVLVISHKSGEDIWACTTEKTAYKSLYEYVKYWWADELGDLEMPDDRDEAIREYFERVESEWYMLEQVDIEGEGTD